jgi:hypothetical protein
MLSASCYMFRHQVAILRDFTNNEVPKDQHVLQVLVAITFIIIITKLKTKDFKMLTFSITIAHKHSLCCCNTNNHKPIPEEAHQYCMLLLQQCGLYLFTVVLQKFYISKSSILVAFRKIAKTHY